jgi:hypothetical protein
LNGFFQNIIELAFQINGKFLHCHVARLPKTVKGYKKKVLRLYLYIVINI